MDKRVLVAVTGGIAAYKACDVVSQLQHAGCKVRVIMSPAATEFVNPITFTALTGEKVYTDTFDYSEDARIQHIVLGQEADCMVVVPATADILAKMAHGLGDCMVSSTFLAATCPVVVCPAMHTNMYANPAVQANIELLKSRGIQIVEPAVGRLASGDTGKGPLAPVEEIVSAVLAAL